MRMAPDSPVSIRHLVCCHSTAGGAVVQQPSTCKLNAELKRRIQDLTFAVCRLWDGTRIACRCGATGDHCPHCVLTKRPCIYAVAAVKGL